MSLQSIWKLTYQKYSLYSDDIVYTNHAFNDYTYRRDLQTRQAADDNAVRFRRKRDQLLQKIHKVILNHEPLPTRHSNYWWSLRM